MITYNEVLNEARRLLKSQGIADADADAWYLLAHVLGINRVQFLMCSNMEFPETAQNIYQELINKRAMHIPLQYLTGTQEFMGLEFEVNDQVLIPRQDTEILVEEVLQVCSGKSVLDVCTGSGCIIISLAKLGNLKTAAGIDISEPALKVAMRNAERLDAPVHFFQSDLFQEVSEAYDIIVSNPPYIPSGEIPKLMPEVREHEPVLALDGSPDGLLFYRRITAGLRKHLKPGGYIFFEIGYDQGEEVVELLISEGLVDVKISKDLSGLDRVVSGMRPNSLEELYV